MTDRRAPPEDVAEAAIDVTLPQMRAHFDAEDRAAAVATLRILLAAVDDVERAQDRCSS